MTRPLRDYLFVYPILRPIGGAEATAAWMLQTLCDRGTVTVVTAEHYDLEALDRACGTQLADAELRIVRAQWWLSERLERLGQPHDLWQFRYFVRQARRMRAQHRFCVSAFNDLDLGAEVAFQYLQVPPVNQAAAIREKTYSLSDTPLMRALVWLFIATCDRLVPWSETNIANNWTATNSVFTDHEFQKVYGRSADAVVFPPPLGESSSSPAPRRRSFLTLARAEPKKGWSEAIAIVAGLRERGHDVGLSGYSIPGQAGYLEWLREQTATKAPWFELTESAPREQIDRAIACHRYGLHASHLESYGMAIAELVLGGCLTAVRRQGGQTEIVTEPELQFDAVAEGVEKLHRVLSSPELEKRLLISQMARRERFTRERFLRDFEICLDRFEAVWS